MKIDKKTLIIGGIILGISTFILVNRLQKKKLYKTLMSDLESGTGSGDEMETGMLTQKGGALNTATFQNTPGGRLQPLAKVQEDIEKIHGWIHGFLGSSNEDALISYFSTLKAQTQVSQVAFEYQKKYGIALADDIKTIDFTPLGIRTGSFDVPKVVAAIQSLPLK